MAGLGSRVNQGVQGRKTWARTTSRKWHGQHPPSQSLRWPVPCSAIPACSTCFNSPWVIQIESTQTRDRHNQTPSKPIEAIQINQTNPHPIDPTRSKTMENGCPAASTRHSEPRSEGDEVGISVGCGVEPDQDGGMRVRVLAKAKKVGREEPVTPQALLGIHANPTGLSISSKWAAPLKTNQAKRGRQGHKGQKFHADPEGRRGIHGKPMAQTPQSRCPYEWARQTREGQKDDQAQNGRSSSPSCRLPAEAAMEIKPVNPAIQTYSTQTRSTECTKPVEPSQAPSGSTRQKMPIQKTKVCTRKPRVDAPTFLFTPNTPWVIQIESTQTRDRHNQTPSKPIEAIQINQTNPHPKQRHLKRDDLQALGWGVHPFRSICVQGEKGARGRRGVEGEGREGRHDENGAPKNQEFRIIDTPPRAGDATTTPPKLRRHNQPQPWPVKVGASPS